jgi:hypothetical protein
MNPSLARTLNARFRDAAALIAGMIILSSGGSALAVVTPNSAFFDFNGLSPGTLVGQDGWAGNIGVPSPLLAVPPAVNNTLAATGSAGLTNLGVNQFAMHAGGGPGGSLGAGGISGNHLVLTMDGESSAGPNQAVAGIGSNVSGSIFADFSFAFFFGVNEGVVGVFRENTGAIATSALNQIKPTYELTDWYGFQMQVDLTANSGNGSGGLSIRDLTDGEVSYTAVPGIQNINLQLLTSAAPNPSEWNRIAVWIRNSYLGKGAVDNVGFQVPEPSAGVLVGVALPVMLAVIRKRKHANTVRAK